MRGKLWFLGGLAAGYVLGTKAGRERYEELARTARKIKESPTMQEAAGVLQEQATRIYTEGKGKVANSRLAETRFGERLLAPGQTTPMGGSTGANGEPLTSTSTTRAPEPGPGSF